MGGDSGTAVIRRARPSTLPRGAGGAAAPRLWGAADREAATGRSTIRTMRWNSGSFTPVMWRTCTAFWICRRRRSCRGPFSRLRHRMCGWRRLVESGRGSMHEKTL